MADVCTNRSLRKFSGSREKIVIGFRMTTDLMKLLRRRLAIISDHSWRDRDAAGHLEALKEVSEKISEWTVEHRAEVDAQLRHFLANASYQKALAHLEALERA